MVASAATTDPNIDYSLAWKVLSGIFPGLGRNRKKTIFVYSKNDGSTLKIAEELTSYGTVRPKIIETPFASIQIGESVTHSSFGDGIVEKITDGMMIVNFNGTKKQFQYPQALQNGFLQKK